MSVKSISLKTFKFLTLFVAIVGTIDAGVTSGRLKSPDLLPAQTGEIQEKLLTHKIYCNNWGKIYFLYKVKYSVGVRMNITKIIFFFIKTDELG